MVSVRVFLFVSNRKLQTDNCQHLEQWKNYEKLLNLTMQLVFQGIFLPNFFASQKLYFIFNKDWIWIFLAEFCAGWQYFWFIVGYCSNFPIDTIFTKYIDMNYSKILEPKLSY